MRACIMYIWKIFDEILKEIVKLEQNVLKNQSLFSPDYRCFASNKLAIDPIDSLTAYRRRKYHELWVKEIIINFEYCKRGKNQSNTIVFTRSFENTFSDEWNCATISFNRRMFLQRLGKENRNLIGSLKIVNGIFFTITSKTSNEL